MKFQAKAAATDIANHLGAHVGENQSASYFRLFGRIDQGDPRRDHRGANALCRVGALDAGALVITGGAAEATLTRDDDGRYAPLRVSDASIFENIDRILGIAHIEVYAPGTYGQKHGHLNSAVFFVLKGRGHDVHDGRRIDWKAGEIMLVENGCVHQHFAVEVEQEEVAIRAVIQPG